MNAEMDISKNQWRSTGRDAPSGGAGGAAAPPDFGRSEGSAGNGGAPPLLHAPPDF